jgi:hypothetical protein
MNIHVSSIGGFHSVVFYIDYKHLVLNCRLVAADYALYQTTLGQFFQKQ